MPKARIAGVLHTEVPRSAGQRGQIFPITVEIGAGVECVEWNLQRAPQEVAEEQKVKGICMTKRSGPRTMWLLGRKKATNNIFWAQVQMEGAVALNPMPKTIVSLMGRLSRKYNSVRVIQKIVRWERRERGAEKERERSSERGWAVLWIEVGTG
jgi:hypothetical protein